MWSLGNTTVVDIQSWNSKKTIHYNGCIEDQVQDTQQQTFRRGSRSAQATVTAANVNCLDHPGDAPCSAC